MTDKIVYLVTDHGMDGRGHESILFASFDEQARDRWFDGCKNKAYFSKTKRIIEVEKELKQTLAKLNGIHRLMLSIPQRAEK